MTTTTNKPQHHWTVNGPISTATVIAPIDRWTAVISIAAPVSKVREAAHLLGILTLTVRPSAFADQDSSTFQVPVHGYVAETPHAVAQAAAEGIARSIAHVIAAMDEAAV